MVGNGVLFLIGVYIFAATFGTTIGPMVYTYIAEIVPPVGLSMAASTQWGVSLIVAMYALDIIDAIGVRYLGLILSAILLIGALYVQKFAVDPRNKSK